MDFYDAFFGVPYPLPKQGEDPCTINVFLDGINYTLP
jgi:aminopeptidase N